MDYWLSKLCLSMKRFELHVPDFGSYEINTAQYFCGEKVRKVIQY